MDSRLRDDYKNKSDDPHSMGVCVALILIKPPGNRIRVDGPL